MVAGNRSQLWPARHTRGNERVETLPLRPGLSLVLSRYDAGEERRFRYVEPEDMFGIGFHLKGGSRFSVEGSRFETQPFDTWVGTAPRGAESKFRLPEHGFQTVALRFAPAALQDLLPQHGSDTHSLREMARFASERVVFDRLAQLDHGTCQYLEAMFATPYTGSARTLFLESCALGLLANQLDKVMQREQPAAADVSATLKQRLATARDYLDAHFTDPPTIRALARIAGTNEFSLKRGFRVVFGITIFGYVRQRRMEVAMEQLRAGQSVSDTAQTAGYACPRSFALAFRRHFGALPSAVSRRLPTETPDHPA
ncbi:MAG: AraC family transcriptional regulator [Pseudomonadota bacterium]